MSEHATVIDKGLNVRAGPGVAYDVLDRLDLGNKVVIIERDRHWAKVQPQNGSKRGWVHSASLRMDAVPAPEAAKVEPPHKAPPPPPGVAPIEYDEPISEHDSSPLWFLFALGVIVVLLMWLFRVF